MSTKTPLKISIVGDSISTYKGYNPYNYPVYYTGETAKKNQLDCVENTWWMQVINGLGGELCINNSLSGSLVSGLSNSSACSLERCSQLHSEVLPDIILIYMGTNDRGCEVEVGLDTPHNTNAFYGAYRLMLTRVKRNYPSAKIFCATLLLGKLKDGVCLDYDRFMRLDESYNQAIRLATKEEECLLVDLAQSKERYETLDYCHPTKPGHTLLANLWLENLKRNYFS